MTMILRSSPPSPFGRKIKIAAALCALTEKLGFEPTDTGDPDDSLREQNPLGKIPVLITDDGTAIYDSRVIAEWMDVQAGGGVILPRGEDRIAALTLGPATADGKVKATIKWEYAILEWNGQSATFELNETYGFREIIEAKDIMADLVVDGRKFFLDFPQHELKIDYGRFFVLYLNEVLVPAVTNKIR